MVCSPCLRRSAVLAAVAPAIARLAPRRQRLLSVLALPSERLLRAVRVQDPRGLLRGLQLPALTDSVPTALCRHDAGYPRALRQLPSAPAVLYATCTPERLCELRSRPTVAIVGSRRLTPYTEQITFTLARDLARAGSDRSQWCQRGARRDRPPRRTGRRRAHDRGDGVLWRAHTSPGRIACSNKSAPVAQPFRSFHPGSSNRTAGASPLPSASSPRSPTCSWSSRRADIPARRSPRRSPRSWTGYRRRARAPQRPWRRSEEFCLLRDGAHPVGNAEDVLEVIHGAGARGPAPREVAA